MDNGKESTLETAICEFREGFSSFIDIFGKELYGKSFF